MFYGQHLHSGSATWTTDLERAPCNLHRIWDVDDAVSWDAIDQPGGYVWTALDWRVAVAKAAGCQVSYVVGIVPQRLRTNTVTDGHNIPGAASFPSDLGAFRAFIRALVARYPAADMPIIELPELVAPAFNRSAAYLALMVQIMREEAPDRLIPSPSFYSIAHAAEYFAEDSRCDALNLHLYGNTASQLRDTLAAYDAVLADAGVKTKDGGKPPVWLSEFGWRKDQTNADWPIEQLDDAGIAVEMVAGTFALLKERGDVGGAWYSWEPKRPDVLLSMADKPELIAAMAAALGELMPAPTKPTYPARPTGTAATTDALNLWMRECEMLDRQYGNALTAYSQENYLAANAAATAANQSIADNNATLAAAYRDMAAAHRAGGEAQMVALIAAQLISIGVPDSEAMARARAVVANSRPRPIFGFN